MQILRSLYMTYKNVRSDGPFFKIKFDDAKSCHRYMKTIMNPKLGIRKSGLN